MIIPQKFEITIHKIRVLSYAERPTDVYIGYYNGTTAPEKHAGNQVVCADFPGR